jgi:hypothetical protein
VLRFTVVGAPSFSSWPPFAKAAQTKALPKRLPLRSSFGQFYEHALLQLKEKEGILSIYKNVPDCGQQCGFIRLSQPVQ